MYQTTVVYKQDLAAGWPPEIKLWDTCAEARAYAREMSRNRHVFCVEVI